MTQNTTAHMNASEAKPIVIRRQMQAPSGLGFVFKVTERCNLACPYCYFFFAGDESYKEHPALVPPETVGGLIAFVKDAVESSGVSYVSIGFHGGEPLLLKKSYFAEICQRLRAELEPSCKLRLSLQTNGVLLDEEWIALFQIYQVSIGVSFDGDETAHNRTRITKKGKGTYAETLRGWRMLIAAHRAGKIVRPYILCVVSPAADGAATLRHFTDELGATGMDFLLPDITHDSLDANKKFVDACEKYLIDVCNEWLRFPPGRIRIRFIDEIVKAFLDDDAMADSAMNKYDSSALMTVSSDGTLSSDDAFRSLSLRFRNTGFNVKNHTYADLQQSDVWSELYSAEKVLPQKCESCLWRNVCRGGAKQHRFSLRNGFNNPSLYCKALANVYGFLASELIRGGSPACEIEERLGMRY